MSLRLGHPLVGYAALAVGFVVAIFGFPSLWLLFLAAGVVLVIVSRFAPAATSFASGGPALSHYDSEVFLPSEWNEREVSLGFEQYKNSPSLLVRYIDGITSRFITGQEQRTVEARTQFLDSFNKYAEVAREAYRWHRVFKGGRAKVEEDIEDIKAQAELQKAQAELEAAKAQLELLSLAQQSKIAASKLEIERINKQIADLKKPEPAPQPEPETSVPLTPAEIRERKKNAFARREREVRSEIAATRADSGLTDEQRQRKLNGLEDKLAEIHEAQADLL